MPRVRKLPLFSDLSEPPETSLPKNGYTIADILKSSDYALNVFDADEIAELKLFDKRGKAYLIDFVNSKERPATPEEIVRQLYVYRLIYKYGYPVERITIEKGVQFGSSIAEKRADIFISDEDHPNTAYIIVEVKKPKRKDGIEQLKSYCNAEGAPIAVWTNGGEIVMMHREDPNYYRNLSDIPRADQTLSQIVNKRVTIEELTEENRLITQQWTLKKIIRDLEDLVLANAGVDAFEEVFKLIYAKLYDEWRAYRRTGHVVEFRAAGETHQQLYDKVSRLFEEAKTKWPDVFLEGERIDLTPAHLAVCVSFLQDIKLFNSNLQIIDEAFEYLSTQVSKGSKGQYFTPRHVIDMCVKMLNPKDFEYMIDTAAGSCGFTVHTIFHVWGGQLTAQGPTREQAEYASNLVYGLDFDARSVKIARALNLIAGDGRTNVFRVNTLDPRNWSEEARVALRPRLRRFPKDSRRNEMNQKGFRYFDFDIVMTNPPFAGDVADSRILHQYEIAKQWRGVDLEKLTDESQRDAYLNNPFRHRFRDAGNWATSQSRDVLFLERNLDFLKPGGRMAIVLPQGRLNNIGDEYVRWWVSQQARILAVVGLHVNTFKPHTGTKTSVLFLQKWNDDPTAGPLCPRVEDYPIFFATSERGGKNNSGDEDYVLGPDGRYLQDLFGHNIIDHDLYDTRSILKTQMTRLLERDKANATKCAQHEQRYRELLEFIPYRPTIAEAFFEFARSQGLSFWQEG